MFAYSRSYVARISTHLLLIGSLAGTAQPFSRADDAPAASSFAISHVTLIDVEAGKPLADRTIIIAGDKITRVGPAAETKIPPGAKTIDGASLFLMPGLFDAHVHYIDEDTYGQLFIAHGVTFVRDMAGFTEQILALRDQLNRGELLGPEMICCGAILDGKPPVWPFSEVCETPDEGRAAVNKLADKGVNQIKVYSVLKKDAYEAIVAEVHKRGLKAVGHVPEDVPLEDALRAHQDSCEHLTGFGAAIGRLAGKAPAPSTQAMASHIESFKAWSLLPTIPRASLDAFLKQVRESGMVQCPTLVVIKGISRMNDPEAKKDPRMKFVNDAMTTFWFSGKYGEFGKYAGIGLPHMQKLVAELHKAGVPLMIGTDLANPFVFAGASVHDEMVMFQEAGIPAADVLRSATVVPARFCGVGDRLGSVSEGRTASLVLLRANPLDDIRNVSKIESVFLRGRYFERGDLNKLLNETRRKVKAGQSRPETVKLEVPGKEIVRGRYKITFNGMDSGDELFVISESDDGFHLMAQTRPTGGWEKPSVLKMTAGKDHAPRTAEWRQQAETPIVATYAYTADEVTAVAREGEKSLPPQVVKTPTDVLYAAPVYASEFLSINAANLKVGESKTFHSLGFGFPDWRLETAKVTATRKADTTLTRPGGKTAAARHYGSTLEIPNIGAFIEEIWTDDRGVMLKATMKMPFGTVGAELE